MVLRARAACTVVAGTWVLGRRSAGPQRAVEPLTEELASRCASRMTVILIVLGYCSSSSIFFRSERQNPHPRVAPEKESALARRILGFLERNDQDVRLCLFNKVI